MRKQISISDLIASQFGASEAADLVQRATADGLTGQELQVSLVMSGAAMGAERIQQYAIGVLHGQIDLLRKAITDTETKIAEAAGDDAMVAFASDLRSKFLERVREHIDMVLASYAQTAEANYGIDASLFLSTLPFDEMDQLSLRAAGAAVSMLNPESFHGFVVTPDVGKMKCPCLFHLAQAAAEKRMDAEKVMRKAVERWGSIDTAMLEFGKFMIAKVRKEMQDFEDKFGDTDSVTSQQADAQTASILSRFISGAVRDQGDSH